MPPPPSFRVEDDESCSTFPFNSCGTAAYVAPEALISNKKVNSSVDVYAFGIMMWEVYTGGYHWLGPLWGLSFKRCGAGA